MRHLGLFEGIGGFSLAARRMGWTTEAWVEIDPFCQKVLNKNFPNSKGYGDIKTFDGTPYNGKIDIITGGFPCQPFSVAGNRKGTADERSLWHEMLRVIREIEPSFIVAENVRGLLTISNGLVFERICLDLEDEGYQVQAVVVPACAVGAPHRRDRVWIVAKNANRNGWQRNGHKKAPNDGQFGNVSARNEIGICDEKNDTDPNGNGHQVTGTGQQPNRLGQFYEAAPYSNRERESQQGDLPQHLVQWNSNGGKYQNWFEAATDLCGMDNGIPSELDKLRNSDRNKRIKALGNSIVPEVAFRIFQAIEESL